MDKTQNDKLIIRNFSLEDMFASEDEKGVISGHASVYEQRVAIGNYFFEEIAAGAFNNTDFSDVRFFINHDWSKLVLARHRRGKRSTMDVAADNKGLFFKALLDIENNTDSRNAHSAVIRGDITGVSLAMIVGKEEWSDLDKDMPIRRILEVKSVFEISPVNDPAYSQTDITARSATLDNEKRALDNARAVRMLDDRKRAEIELEKQKLFILTED
jgi:HK97 family phage prohead protease